MDGFGAPRLLLRLAIVLPCLQACAALADVTIHTSWTQVEQEVFPRQQVHRSRHSDTLVLSGTNQISIVKHNGQIVQHRLGEDYAESSPLGTRRGVHIRVVNGSIVGIFDLPTFTAVDRISTDGHSSCRLSISWHLKPGHKFFELLRRSNHERIFLSDIHAEDTSCSIAAEP